MKFKIWKRILGSHVRVKKDLVVVSSKYTFACLKVLKVNFCTIFDSLSSEPRDFRIRQQFVTVIYLTFRKEITGTVIILSMFSMVFEILTNFSIPKDLLAVTELLQYLDKFSKVIFVLAPNLAPIFTSVTKWVPKFSINKKYFLLLSLLKGFFERIFNPARKSLEKLGC